MSGRSRFAFVFDDFERIGKILGVRFATRIVPLYGGGTRQKPRIWFSGFWSQGDGACFEGEYEYAKAAPKHIRAYAPKDAELHRIADALQSIQRLNFYQLYSDDLPSRILHAVAAGGRHGWSADTISVCAKSAPT